MNIPEAFVCAVVRLTAPGVEDSSEVISEWQGVTRVQAEPVYERDDLFSAERRIYCYPTPRLTSVTLHLDMSNASVTRLDLHRILDDPVGLELWSPLTEGDKIEWLDPLEPRCDWDTSTDNGMRVHYHFGRVAQYTHQSFLKGMTVNVFRGPNVNELCRMEVTGS